MHIAESTDKTTQVKYCDPNPDHLHFHHLYTTVGIEKMIVLQNKQILEFMCAQMHRHTLNCKMLKYDLISAFLTKQLMAQITNN